MHDFQLQRQIQELRDERDRTRKAALDGANKPAVVDDDLRWLLDKEPDGGSIAAGAAKVEQAELAEVAEHVTKQRIAYGTLKNSNLRRQRKLDALEEELRMVKQEMAETPADRRNASRDRERHDATKARVIEMEQLAAEQVEYTATLDMLIKRLLSEKGGGNEMLQRVRDKMAEIDLKTDRQTAESGVINHSSWQAKNGMQLQLTINDKGRRARQILVSKRKKIITKGKSDVASLSDDLLKQQEEIRQAEAAQQAELIKAEGVRAIEQQAAAERLKRLEEEFVKIQRIMGFAGMEEVVDKLIEQREASARMEVMKTETIERQETLIEEKARLDLAYEEQLGGVDSELNYRRHKFDEFVKAEEEWQEAIQKRKGRVDDLSLLLTKAHIGLSQLEKRLSTVPQLMLRGNLMVRNASANLRDRDVLSTMGDDVADRASTVGERPATVAEGNESVAGNEGGGGGGGPSSSPEQSFKKKSSDSTFLTQGDGSGEEERSAAVLAARRRDELAAATARQLEGMMEAEVQMVRTITHCESELTFLLGQIDKAANKQSGITATATKELQQASAPAAADFIPKQTSLEAQGAFQRRQSGQVTSSSNSGNQQKDVMNPGLLWEQAGDRGGGGGGGGGGPLSPATTFDYSQRNDSGPFGSHNMRLYQKDADEMSDNFDLNQQMKWLKSEQLKWKGERMELKQLALGLPPLSGKRRDAMHEPTPMPGMPSGGAATPNMHRRSSAGGRGMPQPQIPQGSRRPSKEVMGGNTNYIESSGAASARADLGGRRGSFDGPVPGSAGARRSSMSRDGLLTDRPMTVPSKVARPAAPPGKKPAAAKPSPRGAKVGKR